MTYDEFKKGWVSVLRESGLPIMGVEPIAETLCDRACDRLVQAKIERLEFLP